MALTTFDGVISSMTGGKHQFNWYQKSSVNSTSYVRGRSCELFTSNGIPCAGSFSGTAGVATSCDSTTAGALQLPTFSSDKGHLLSTINPNSVGVTVPMLYALCDLLLYYPSCVITGTPTTLDNTVTLPRYTDGKGVFPVIAMQTDAGANTNSITLTYTNTAPTTGRTASAVVGGGRYASSLYQYAQYGLPYVPLAAGDLGCKKVESYSLASGTTGTAAIMLVKPLCWIKATVLITDPPVVRNFITQVTKLPHIQESACLILLGLNLGGTLATNTRIHFGFNLVWG